MHVEVAVLADGANVTGDGKLNILGAFNTISAPNFPAVHPMMVLVLRFRVEYAEAMNEHQINVVIRDEDRGVIRSFEAPVPSKEIAPGSTAIAHPILPLRGIVFTSPGTYLFEILWDGKPHAEIPLYVHGTR